MNAVDHAINRPFSFHGGDIEPLIPEGIAETHAKISENSADHLPKRTRRSMYALAQRRRAAWWRKLPTLSEKQVDQVCDELFVLGSDTIDALLVCIDKNEGALTSLVLLASQILDGLLKQAAMGKKGAPNAFLNSIGPAVNSFEFLATRKPEIFREQTRSAIAIPGLISRHRAQSQYNDKLLDGLQQGYDSPLAAFMERKRGRFWAYEGANLLAWRCINHIEAARLAYDDEKILARHRKSVMPPWRIEAAELKSFSEETWENWANVAWAMIADVSPEKNPALHPGFYDPRTKICNVRQPTIEPVAGNSEKSRSVQKHDIKEALFGAFELIATAKSRRTKERHRAKVNRQTKPSKRRR